MIVVVVIIDGGYDGDGSDVGDVGDVGYGGDVGDDGSNGQLCNDCVGDDALFMAVVVMMDDQQVWYIMANTQI